MKRKIAILVVMLLVLTLAFSACGKSEVTSQPEGKEDVLKVALILPGKADDVSFNQAMYEGLRDVCEEYGDKIEFTYVEEVYEVADIEPALIDYASEGYDVIFGHGFQFMEPVIKVAEMYPDVMFCQGMGYKTANNVAVYDVHLQAGGYMMGILAASMTETGKIGVIGGGNVSEIFRGHEGYKYAAQKINPDIEIQEVYTGDWTDSAGAKEAAMSMYDSGVDIIWHSGDGIGLGCVEAAKEKNKYVLGNIADQNELAPNNVLSGVVYEWKSVIKAMIEDIMNDEFAGREDMFYWIVPENGGLVYSDYHGLADKVPEDVKTLMEETLQGFIDGEIEMPDFEAE